MPAHGYRYTKSEEAYLSTIGDDVDVSALEPHIREIWNAPDGSGRLLDRPDELYDQIRQQAEGHGNSTDSKMLVAVGDLLRETVAPPQGVCQWC